MQKHFGSRLSKCVCVNVRSKTYVAIVVHSYPLLYHESRGNAHHDRSFKFAGKDLHIEHIVSDKKTDG